MSKTIRLGISTCPNDTFAFHALLHRLVDWRGLDFQVELLDIQQLNDRCCKSKLPRSPSPGGSNVGFAKWFRIGLWCRPTTAVIQTQ